jgi:hypothetical protein
MKPQTKRSNSKLWERIKNQVKAQNVAGTRSGQWSARKAQLAVRKYKEAGGRYVGPRSKSNSLVEWTSEAWRTESGKPSHITGERYLPSKAFASLSRKELDTINRSKRAARARGQQYSRMPKSIQRKLRSYR